MPWLGVFIPHRTPNNCTEKWVKIFWIKKWGSGSGLGSLLQTPEMLLFETSRQLAYLIETCVGFQCCVGSPWLDLLIHFLIAAVGNCQCFQGRREEIPPSLLLPQTDWQILTAAFQHKWREPVAEHSHEVQFSPLSLPTDASPKDKLPHLLLIVNSVTAEGWSGASLRIIYSATGTLLTSLKNSFNVQWGGEHSAPKFALNFSSGEILEATVVISARFPPRIPIKLSPNAFFSLYHINNWIFT